MQRFFTLIVAALGCISSATPAPAATYNWTSNINGTFNVPTNWTPTVVPSSIDTAIFSVNSTYTVAFTTTNTVINTLQVDRGDVTFDVNANTFRTTNLTASGMGNTAQTATLRFTDGTYLPGNFSVGIVSGAVSNLILDTGSTTTVGTGPFLVGVAGTGNVTVQNGAVLNSSGAGLGINAAGVGSATVSGTTTASTWNITTAPLRIGSNGTGTLNIGANGTVTAFGLEIGENLSSIGTLTVGGLASSFTTAGTANIGGTSATLPAASATLNIASGATVGLTGTTNLRANARINMTGGTLNLDTVNVATGAAVNWQAGTINFANGTGLTTGLLDTLLGGTRTLGANQTLSAAAGTMNLASTLIVAGGRVTSPIVTLNADIDVSGFGSIAAGTTMTIGAGRTIQLRDFSTLGATTSITNSGGTFVLNGRFVNVTGPFINNGGYVRGVGRFTGGLNNGAAGTVRLETGDHIIIDQTSRTNAGTIELAGGTIEYSQSLTNQATGVIMGRGMFRGSSAAPGGIGLDNQGVLSFSAGITDVFGDVNNSGAGKIIAAGGSVVTFYDDVVHNGAEIRTNTGSRSVFFGSVTGAGPFTGGGDVELNGDLKPGNSPANVSFGGNVLISPTAGLGIELGSTVKGTGYDAVTVGGTLSLGGDLNVSLLNNFVPQYGQSFEIITAGGVIDGTFDTEHLPAIGYGLYFDVIYEPHAVKLAVVGLPGDYTNDGYVDAADYVAQRAGLTPSLPADSYTPWQGNFGNTNGGGSAVDLPNNEHVPEPTSLLLALTAALLPIRTRRSRT